MKKLGNERKAWWNHNYSIKKIELLLTGIEKDSMMKDFKSCKGNICSLYNDEFIYQGEYMVNWCPRCGTALADDEVEHVEKDGHLWHVKYPVKDSDEFIIIATSRPETMSYFDVAVAVHPEDDDINIL